MEAGVCGDHQDDIEPSPTTAPMGARPYDRMASELIQIESRMARAFADPLGARMTSLVVAERERLVTEPVVLPGVAPYLTYGCFPMLPWVGRLPGTTLEWGGQRFPFTPNLGEHAAHGLTASADWHVMNHASNAVTFGLDLSDVGWPFGGWVEHRIELEDSHLSFLLRMKATHAGPMSAGWHPWFQRDAEAFVGVEANLVLGVDSHFLPSARALPVDRDRDLRGYRLVDDLEVDDVYVDPRPPAVMGWSDITVLIHWGETVNAVTVYTDPQGVCIEPTTAHPGAYGVRTPADAGICSLAPDETFEVYQRWSWVTTSSRRSSD